MRKYSHFFTTVLTVFVLILAAGCGGGGATSVGPSLPTDSPIVVPTATPVQLAIVHGLVLKADGKTPEINGAVVEMKNSMFPSSASSNQGNYSSTVTADASGLYRLVDVPYGTYRIRFYQSVSDQTTDPNNPLGIVDNFIVDRLDMEKNLVAGEVNATPTPIIPPVNTPTPDPNDVIPSNVGQLFLTTGWVNSSMEIVRLPEVDYFSYMETQGGTDQILSQQLDRINATTDATGELKIQISPGRFAIYQVASSSEKYFIGEVELIGGQQTDLLLRGIELVTLSIKIRSKLPTTFLDYQEYMKIIGYLSDQSTGKISTLLFDFRNNFEIKQWQLMCKLPKRTYKFTATGKNIKGSEYQINPEQYWNLTEGVEKKLLINNISPGADSNVFNLDDPRLLVGGVQEAGYAMIKTNPGGELVICTYDPSVVGELKDKVAILNGYDPNQYYVMNIPVKTTVSSPLPDTKMLSLSSRQATGDGQHSWCNILGSYFLEFGKEFIAQIIFRGQPKVGFRVDAYEGAIDVGAGPVTINAVGNFNATTVNKFPGE